MNKFIEENFSLEGKVAIVTGGNTGLGLAYVDALSSAGADILITAFDDNTSEARKIVEGNGKKIRRRKDLFLSDQSSGDPDAGGEEPGGKR